MTCAMSIAGSNGDSKVGLGLGGGDTRFPALGHRAALSCTCRPGKVLDFEARPQIFRLPER